MEPTTLIEACHRAGCPGEVVAHVQKYAILICEHITILASEKSASVTGDGGETDPTGTGKETKKNG